MDVPNSAGSDAAAFRGNWAAWLAALAVGYGFFHHVGTLVAPLGDIGETRWADWVDLLTPYVVVGLAAASTAAAGARPRAWGAFGVGAVMYTQGQ